MCIFIHIIFYRILYVIFSIVAEANYKNLLRLTYNMILYNKVIDMVILKKKKNVYISSKLNKLNRFS